MTVLTPDIAQVETQIVEMTNTFRAESRLGVLKVNAELVRAARAYAEFLARSTLFSHTADGRQVSDRTKAAGYAHCQVAENLALFEDSRGFRTAQLAASMVEGWKASPGHRKNMLAPHVVETGVAVAKAAGAEKYLSVQLFGRPEALKYRFKITNTARAVVTYRLGDTAHEVRPSTIVEHTQCLPATLAFDKAVAAGAPPRPLTGRYEARDGDTFTVKAAGADQLRVDYTPRKQ